jgi:hypothetical protein
MAKELHNDVYDAALDKIATCTHVNFCTSQPANFAGIAAVSIANATVTPGDGNFYTVADGDASGRKVTGAALVDMDQAGAGDGTLTANGTVGFVVLDDGATLLAVTTGSGTVVDFTTETWDSPAFDIEMEDPT